MKKAKIVPPYFFLFLVFWIDIKYFVLWSLIFLRDMKEILLLNWD